MKLSVIKTNKFYPAFIRSSEAFSKNDKIRKIFPLLGLRNFSIPLGENIEDASLASAVTLLHDINRQIKAIMRQPLGPTIFKILREVGFLFVEQKKFVLPQGGKLTLNIYENILVDGKVIFKKGESLFRVYGKLNALLKNGSYQTMPALEKISSFKDFSSTNIPREKCNIVFSSDGMKGAVDIATMSMRGISSCQSWSAGNYKKRLIGSIIDPCTAIIYLTKDNCGVYKLGPKMIRRYNCGAYKLGPKMIRRCIVRLVVDGNTNQPSLFLEKMYPYYDEHVAKAFVSAIKSKIKNIPIINNTDSNRCPKSLFIPITKSLENVPSRQYPYVDCRMPFKALSDADVATNIVIKMISKYKSFSVPLSSRDLDKLSPEDRRIARGLTYKSGWRLTKVNTEHLSLLKQNSPTSSKILNFNLLKGPFNLYVMKKLFGKATVKTLTNRAVRNLFALTADKPSPALKSMIADKLEKRIISSLKKDNEELSKIIFFDKNTEEYKILRLLREKL